MILLILALINLFFGFASFFVFLKLGVLQYFLWFCNHQAFVYAFAIYKRYPRLISAELCLGLIPQLLWCIDFLGYLILGKFIFGITEYMFVENYASSTYYISLQHFILVPIALFALYNIGKPTVSDWKLTLVHVFFMILFTFALSTQEYNVNCVFENACVPFLPAKVPFWPIVWGLITFFILILPTNYLLYQIYNH